MSLSVASLSSAFTAVKPQNAALDRASEDFEAMFMSQMLQPMFETVEVSPLFGGGHGEEAMRGFLVQEYGKAMAAGTDFGLADAVKAELVRIQAARSGASLTGAEG